MDSGVALLAVENHARDTASALSIMGRSMQGLVTMTFTDIRSHKILEKVVDQNTEFYASLGKSAVMFQSCAQTARRVEELLRSMETLDAAGLEKMAQDIQREAKETAGLVKGVYQDLQSIASDVHVISQHVPKLAATLQTEHEQTRIAHDQAHTKQIEACRRKSKNVKRIGRSLLKLLHLLYLNIFKIDLWFIFSPFIACFACRQEKKNKKKAKNLQKELTSLANEIKLLTESQEKLSVIRGALPDVIKGSEGMYDFYIEIEAKVKEIPKTEARLRYQHYVGRWEALHRNFEKHHAQVEAIASAGRPKEERKVETDVSEKVGKTNQSLVTEMVRQAEDVMTTGVSDIEKKLEKNILDSEKKLEKRVLDSEKEGEEAGLDFVQNLESNFDSNQNAQSESDM